VTSAEDRSRTERLIAETEFLSREIAAIRIALGEVATRDFVRGELEELVDEVEARTKAANEELNERPEA
jgi:hypothetical protein